MVGTRARPHGDWAVYRMLTSLKRHLTQIHPNPQGQAVPPRHPGALLCVRASGSGTAETAKAALSGFHLFLLPPAYPLLPGQTS